jgi:hypothetical protein
MKVEILGTGCYNCIKLEMLIHEVINELGRSDVEIVRINDDKTVLEYMPLDQIPGLLIDGVLVSTRELPERETLVEWLSGKLEAVGPDS